MANSLSFLLLLVLNFSACSHTKANAASGLDADLDHLRVNVRLAQMVGEDQAYRFGLAWLETRGHKIEDVFQDPRFVSEFGQIDKKNTQELKQILKTWGWIKVSQFGPTASQNAWLLVQHADHDPAFQEEVLNLLEAHLKAKDVAPQNYAYLWDRVRVSKKELQRYGTQGACVGKNWEPRAMEDPARVDERRKSMELGPMAEYVKQVGQMCL